MCNTNRKENIFHTICCLYKQKRREYINPYILILTLGNSAHPHNLNNFYKKLTLIKDIKKQIRFQLRPTFLTRRNQSWFKFDWPCLPCCVLSVSGNGAPVLPRCPVCQSLSCQPPMPGKALVAWIGGSQSSSHGASLPQLLSISLNLAQFGQNPPVLIKVHEVLG